MKENPRWRNEAFSLPVFGTLGAEVAVIGGVAVALFFRWFWKTTERDKTCLDAARETAENLIRNGQTPVLFYFEDPHQRGRSHISVAPADEIYVVNVETEKMVWFRGSSTDGKENSVKLQTVGHWQRKGYRFSGYQPINDLEEFDRALKQLQDRTPRRR